MATNNAWYTVRCDKCREGEWCDTCGGTRMVLIKRRVPEAPSAWSVIVVAICFFIALGVLIESYFHWIR